MNNRFIRHNSIKHKGLHKQGRNAKHPAFQFCKRKSPNITQYNMETALAPTNESFMAMAYQQPTQSACQILKANIPYKIMHSAHL